MTSEQPISTSVARRNGATVVRVAGEIDLNTAAAFEAAIGDALAHEPAVLVIELSQVQFMASVGLRILAATHDRVGESVQVAVVASSRAASRPIELTGLDKVFALYPTLDEALQALRTSAE
ncbi:STAS domain-containing protein [Mycobacterium sp.]|uniref:STAS domain-containing protein n=1 Tax=Mycobacterium sp. TaxID=1785 RepID=UPI0012872FAE|nr:STAS domain-containing protein [Mycobacterium sp.]KAA8963887.1 MAG: STAS domain-containing protein [Mycobacterium sp.]